MPNFERIFAVRKASFIMALPNLNTRSTTRKKTTSVDVSAMMYGKIPPQARELEEAILGGILLEKSAFDTVTEILKPECFYVEAHQMIFQSMQSLQQKNMPIDMLTVVEELKMREYLDQVGGAY
jgi:replicative DNA helicase